MKCICPQCGSPESRRRSGTDRVCRECGARFTPPKPLWERSIFAFVFLVPGLIFAIIAVFFLLVALDAPPAPGAFRGALLFGVFSLLCFIQGVRELIGRTKRMSRTDDGDWVGESSTREQIQKGSWLAPLRSVGTRGERAMMRSGHGGENEKTTENYRRFAAAITV